MKIQVRYYAALREQSGCSGETLEGAPATAAEVYELLRARHGFSLDRSRVRVAINNQYGDWHQSLSADDVLVFIPPVAGG